MRWLSLAGIFVELVHLGIRLHDHLFTRSALEAHLFHSPAETCVEQVSRHDVKLVKLTGATWDFLE
jgi:hypothetical protein